MDPLLACITLATFVKDVVELCQDIQDSIDQVGENKEQLLKLRGDVEETIYGFAQLTKGYETHAPSPELSTALEDLKSHLESIHNKCKKASQHASWFKSWWKRDKIDREIKRLNDLKKDCYEQFTLFATARTEGKVDRITDTTTRIEGHAIQILNTTTRIEVGNIQLANTAAQTEDNTRQTAHATTRIEMGTRLIADMTCRIEDTTAQVHVLELKKKLEEWLEYPPNMKKRQDDTQELQHEGTGSWFLCGHQFNNWKMKAGYLWIRGDSGTGKSVLSSIVIRELFSTRQPRTAITYFYFDFRDEKYQCVKIMLQSIVLQLSAQSPKPYSALDRQYNHSQGQSLPTYENLLSILDELLLDFEHTYLILDALDECNEPGRLVQFISRLEDWTKHTLHFLFTSQPRDIFSSVVFQEASVVVLDPDTTQNDIWRFIDSELCQLSHLTHCVPAGELSAKVVKKSNGMFRLAALLLMELRDAFNPDVDTILANLPSNLFEIYSRFFKRIHPTAVVYVSALLRWLAFSSNRRVTLSQLQDALAFDPLNPAEFVYDSKGQANSTYRVCKMLDGIIVVDQELVVHLAHASVEDYLLSEKFAQEYTVYDLQAGPSHRFLAQTCLGYLLHSVNHPYHHNFQNDLLRKYALENWYYHLHLSDNPTLLSSLTICLLQRGSAQFAAFQDFRSRIGDQRGFELHQPLTLCSQLGYTEAVCFLIQDGADPNIIDNHFTALQKACSNGHVDIVHILLESDAKVDVMALVNAHVHGYWDIVQMLLQKGPTLTVNAWITSALTSASKNGHMKIVRILLALWTNLGCPQAPLHDPVVAASKQGWTEIVRLLLDNGFNDNVDGSALQAAAEMGNTATVWLLLNHLSGNTGREYSKALCAASLYNQIDTVQFFLEKVTEANAAAVEYTSALQAAAKMGHTETVRLLIMHGANINAVGGEYGNALCAASFYNRIETVRLLLEKGAIVNATDAESKNALRTAGEKGNTEIVQLLLEHGANINAGNGECNSLLHDAAERGNTETIRLLLENGADVDSEGTKYGNALQAAAVNGLIESVQLLLEYGAKVNMEGGQFGSALRAACYYGRISIVRLLLQHGADVNRVGGAFGNALQAASHNGHTNIVRLLLEHGADVNLGGGKFGNTLQNASHHGHTNIVQLLLKQGADINVIAGEFGTALQAASHHSRTNVVQLLLKNGAEVNTAGGKHGNALCAASFWGNNSTVCLLLQHGANVNAIYGVHGTALQAASFGGHIETVKLLLTNGADVNAVGGTSGSALKAAFHLAKSYKKNWYQAREIVHILLKNGVYKENMVLDYPSDNGWLSTLCESDNEEDRQDIVRINTT
ncbi:ankyrin repeat-containing domain protein [Mycena galopus ATCC 62051]|nr:ankyrin repeat-containing domain protein [Mycena galopus ATCC 62051]